VLVVVFETMSTLKTVALAIAPVLAVGLVPFFWQKSEAAKVRETLAEVEARRTVLEGNVRVLSAARAEAARAAEVAAAETPVRTVGELLAAADEPIRAETLIHSVMEMTMSRDMVGMLRLFLPIANLSTEDFNTLMDEIQAFEGNPQMKEMASQMLASFAPSGDPKESLERLMALEIQPYSYAGKLGEWAQDDPDAALAWYEAKRAAGELDGKGVHNSPEQVLLAQLIGGMAKKDPARALDLYEATSDKDARRQMTWQLGSSLAAHLKETGDDTYFRRLLDADGESREQVVFIAVNGWMEPGKLDDGMEFIEKYLEEPAQRVKALSNMVVNQRDLPVVERGDWLVAHVDAEALPEAVEGFVRRMAWDRGEDLDRWLVAQPGGEARDKGLNALVNAQASQSSYAWALANAERIGDEGMRATALDNLARNWVAAEPEKARVSLPPELLERLEEITPK